MQEITHSSQPKKNSIPVMDFDVEEFDFKPLTKGLGFHHGKDSQPKARTYTKPTHRPAQRTVTPVSKRTQSTPEISLDLPTAKVETPLEKTVKPKKKIRNARMGVQFTSFVFDLIILFGFQGLLNYSFMKVVNLNNISQFIQFTWIEQLAFFCFTYLFYFTVLDLIASPGKKIFNLRMKSTVSKKVTIDQTLIRSVVSLCSFILLFMPLVFDFQGKLSDTRVIEDA